jgi:hypothetical protein
MKLSDLERLDAMRLGKWIIFNGDNTGRDFHIFYDGKEIEHPVSFSMDVEANRPIAIKIEAIILPEE